MKKIYLPSLIFIFMFILTACGGSKAETEKIKTFSEPVVENILIGINEDSYEKYSKDFDETMKKAITEEAFKQTNQFIKDRIGNYVSKSFYKSEKSGKYTTAYYKAKFTKEESDVFVKVVFEQVNGKWYVSGLFMDSVNLRKK